MDPDIPWPVLKVGSVLARKALGMRYVMDVIPLDASLVRGSHGVTVTDSADAPLFISSESRLVPNDTLPAQRVCETLLSHVFTP